MGPVYVPHLKLSFGGTIGQPVLEEFSNSVRFSTNGYDVPEANLDFALQVCEAPLRKWFASAGAQISGNAILTTLKLNWILANGRQRNVNTHERAMVQPGGNGTTPPWYQTYALTHRTALQRGRGHVGRIFPPLVGAMPEGQSPYISVAAATAMANAWATCLNELCDALSQNLAGGGEGVLVGVFPVVASPGESDPTSFKGPIMERITGVVVDRVPDVQHRRTAQVDRAEGARANVVGVDI